MVSAIAPVARSTVHDGASARVIVTWSVVPSTLTSTSIGSKDRMVAADGALSPDYCGFPPVEPPEADGAAAVADLVMAELRRLAPA